VDPDPRICELEADDSSKMANGTDGSLKKVNSVIIELEDELAEARAESLAQAEIIGKDIDRSDKLVMEKVGLETENNKLQSQLAAVKECWEQGLDPFDNGRRDVSVMENLWYAKMDTILSDTFACPGCEEKLDRIRYGDEIVAGLEGRLEMARGALDEFTNNRSLGGPLVAVMKLISNLDAALTADAPEKEKG
jgi:hypothetical protein